MSSWDTKLDGVEIGKELVGVADYARMHSQGHP